jgi:hypothetical protein
LLAHSLGFALGLAVFTFVFFSLFGAIIQLVAPFAMFVVGVPIYAATSGVHGPVWRGTVLSFLVPCVAAPLAMTAICISDRCTRDSFEFFYVLCHSGYGARFHRDRSMGSFVLLHDPL